MIYCKEIGTILCIVVLTCSVQLGRCCTLTIITIIIIIIVIVIIIIINNMGNTINFFVLFS